MIRGGVRGQVFEVRFIRVFLFNIWNSFGLMFCPGRDKTWNFFVLWKLGLKVSFEVILWGTKSFENGNIPSVSSEEICVILVSEIISRKRSVTQDTL